MGHKYMNCSYRSYATYIIKKLTSKTYDLDRISSGREKYKDGVDRNAILPPFSIKTSTILLIVCSEYQYWLKSAFSTLSFKNRVASTAGRKVWLRKYKSIKWI